MVFAGKEQRTGDIIGIYSRFFVTQLKKTKTVCSPECIFRGSLKTLSLNNFQAQLFIDIILWQQLTMSSISFRIYTYKIRWQIEFTL